jgi:hypothetical protein
VFTKKLLKASPVSFRTTKQTIRFPNRWASELGSIRGDDYHGNVEEARNIDSSASGDSAHLSLNQNAYRKRIKLLVCTSVARISATRISKSAHFTISIHIF